MQLMRPSLAPLAERLRTLKPELFESFGVSGLFVFGSYARDEALEDSDLDIVAKTVRQDFPGLIASLRNPRRSPA